MAILAPYVFWQEFDNDGEPLAGGKVYTYAAGTTTPKRTFTDADETAENANPIILDSAGRADIWLDEGAYKFVITDSNDVTIKTVDDFAGDAAGAIVSYDVSTNLNLTATYNNANIYATSTFTINLLPAADAEDGFQFRVYNEGAGVITIDPNSSETINGASTVTIPASCWAFIYCTGTEWFAFVINTMALQSASSVAITGGSISGASITTSSATITGGTITGITDLAIADGGTGASTASAAFDNIKQAATTSATGVVEKANQAEMEAETADKFPSAAEVKYHKGVAKAWVSFNGSGTVAILQSYNVSSITDNGAGDYTVNYSITLDSADGAIHYSSNSSSDSTGSTRTFHMVRARTTTSVRVQELADGGAAPSDPTYVSVTILGDYP